MELTLGFDAAWQWRSVADAPARRARGGFAVCFAASGGSRRDMQKIVARTKHRRARHLKKRSLDPMEEELVRRPHILDISTPDSTEEDREETLDNAQDEEISDEGSVSDEEIADDGVEEISGEAAALDEEISDDATLDAAVEEPEKRNQPEDIAGELRENIEAGAEAVLEGVSGSAPVDRSTGTESKKEEPPHDQERYGSFRVLVAGASGRTGRLVVEKLSKGGAKVRALCRDFNKARRFKELGNVTAVRGDMSKYETLKQGLGDSNVVVCAIGTKAFPLDILKTYQVEYEGVVNLIAAAKNQGHVKKFILVTSIGVSSVLQIIPILWWKRQAELALQRSGLDYTIVRPAGLRESSAADESIDMRPPNSLFFGGISRSKVAEVCVEAIVLPEASEKIVEIVAGSGHKKSSSLQELFSRI